jgi:hypothetical protein
LVVACVVEALDMAPVHLVRTMGRQLRPADEEQVTAREVRTSREGGTD